MNAPKFRFKTAEPGEPVRLRQGALSPRWWPTWFAVGMLYLAGRAPRPARLVAGMLLGQLLSLCMPRRRHIARRNLAYCMAHLGEQARSRVLRQQFHELGIAVMESAATWSIGPAAIERSTRLSGLHNLDAALAPGRGAILVAGHFIPVDMAMQLASYWVTAHAVYRPHKNPVIDFMVLRGRSRQGARMFSREDMRTPLLALRRNQLVWFSPDQDHGLAHGEFVEFFSRPAATVTSTARRAARTGAALVPMHYRRLPGLKGYEVEFGAPLAGFPGDDFKLATRRINRLIEQQAYLMPGQYLWVHRRFKTRPHGVASIYR